jgi:hypothetical protein
MAAECGTGHLQVAVFHVYFQIYHVVA